MEWLIFVVFAYLAWTVCNIVSKILLTKHIKNIFLYGIVIGFVGLLPLLLIPFKGLTLPSFQLLLITLAAGALYIFGMLPYFKALSLEEVSRVIPLWRFKPLFVLLLAFLFIGERLSSYEIIAFFLLLFGGFFISIRKIKDSFTISRAFYFMLLSSVLLAVYAILVKYIYLHQAYYDGFILLKFGSFLGAFSLLFFKRYRVMLKTTFFQLAIK